jgi:single-stranded-DNA-specific exonuclease
MRKKWIIPPADNATVEQLSRSLHVSPVTARMLTNRGLNEPQAARRFLEPSLHQLADPAEHDLLSEAARFLRKAVESGRHITVYGDYDADGICATATMLRCLRGAGADVDCYVPKRFDEGYGLSVEALSELKERGTDLVITVDCGVSAVQEIDHASRLGLEVLVTDHHEPGPQRPDARFVLDPHLPDCDFGYQQLAGVGVAFKLAWAVGQQLNGGASVPEDFRDLMIDVLPLVAIGTIADMVPLTDENRVLAQYGLRVMPKTRNPGLQALLEVAGASGKENLGSYHVGFQLAPRLNAAGRMADAGAAVEMFTTDDPARAAELAEHLEEENRRRRSVQRSTTDEAMEWVESRHDLEGTSSIVISSADWHPGVVGLVASRLAENFWRPTFVFCEEGKLARGSARSIPGFHLFDAISRCEELLERFGGHEGAAGLTVTLENLEEFRRCIDAVIQEELGDEPPIPHLELEGEVELQELSQPVVKELKLLSPYGIGNPEPLFCTRGVELAGNPQIVGSRRNHLSFRVRQNGESLKVIAFGKADWLEQLKAHDDKPFSIAFEPRINTWRNRSSVEMRAEDIQFAGEENIEHAHEMAKTE